VALEDTPPCTGDEVMVGIRPEAFAAGEAVDGWTRDGTIAVLESLGRETLLYIGGGALRSVDSKLQEGFFAVHRTRQIAARHGDPVRVRIKPGAIYLFDSRGRAIAWPDHHSHA
jgi:multiple sugar transport system ATP-binding protein